MPLRHFLTLEDLTPEELARVVDRAIELKRMWNDEVVYEPLRNRTLAMLFTLPSTRTRVAFETGIRQLGGHGLFLAPDDIQFGRGEPIGDTARVLSRMVDLVMIRTASHELMVEFAANASVPVINGMSSRFHPCQLLADMQTFIERRGPIKGKTVAFVGDGYNMCQSYLMAAQPFGFHLKVACPDGYAPEAELVNRVGNSVSLCKTPQQAVANADLVVTDVWSSMGHEEERARRNAAFSGYQINDSLMAKANSGALFMHCLPAHRGEEIAETMLDHPQSAVWDEAENRLHTQKALMEFLYFERRRD